MPIHRYPGGVINADNVTPGANQASGVWTLESQLQANGTGFWPQSTSQMSRSLRFNSADSAYLDRTPAVASNRKTWTWSAWVKRSTISTLQALQTVQDGGTEDSIAFLSGDIIRAYFVGIGGNGVVTNAVFRDPSAWYHIVVAMDTTQATASNRTKIYVNGVDLTSSSSNYLSQNADTKFNGVFPHFLGRYANQSMPTGNLDGYMTEVVFVDGQALDATSFGYTDSNNVWQPKPYSGSVGTNGFYLTFADNTSNTATGIGKDYSNRGNNWTPFNFSVASGAGNDSLVDVPTNWGTDTGLGGEVRGNYCTLNPLKQTGATLTNGNLQFTKAAGSGSTLFTIHSTLFVGAGKWYFEVTPTAVVSGYDLVGVVGPEVALTTYGSLASMTGNLWAYRSDAYKVNNGSSASYGNTWTSNDVIGVAIDMDNSKIWFSKNGTWQASGDPAAGTNAAYTNLTGSVAPLLIDQGAGTFDGFLNAGQRPFAYAAPSGFKALCTQNLPTPTIQNGGQYFNTVLWSGDSTGTTRSISGVGFQPDFVWSKARNQPYRHTLYDAIRGAAADKYLSTANDDLEGAGNFASFYGYVSAFQSDGFQVTKGIGDPNQPYAWVNESGSTYVAWNWNAGGSNATNTNGSLTSTVRANTTAGFSVITYTGNTAADQTVGHGLGVAPSMIIAKCRNSSGRSWVVYHVSLGINNVLVINSTGAVITISGYWSTSNPTSTVFGVKGGGYDNNNGNMVAYCFAAVAGYSAFGSYTGNGSSDGPFVYTGFRPAWIMVKVTNTAGYDWYLMDDMRPGYNAISNRLMPNIANAEITSGDPQLDIVSNGFKLRSGNSNVSTVNYVYAAFAENPFKIARAR